MGSCRGAAGPSFSPSRTGVLNVAKVRPGRLAAAATRTSRANMAVKENEELPEHIEWNVDTEVQLFYAMTGHKPVGVNKYFQMACILEKFRNSVNKDVSSKVIWDHLDTMYDMQALDDTENLPFPNDEKEFNLPENDFGDLMLKKLKVEINVDPEKEAKREVKKEVNFVKNSKDTPKKDTAVTKDGLNRDTKEFVKEVKKDTPKDVKKISKEVKDVRRDSKESIREVRKENKKEVKDTPKEVKQDVTTESKEYKKANQRASLKEKKDVKKDDSDSRDDLPLITFNSRKERTKDTGEETPKRSSLVSVKRATRGVIKGDDNSSTQSSSPTPPPVKRRRT